MSDPFGRDGGKTGSSDPFGRGAGAAAKKSHGGVVGFLEHGLSDVKDTALGIPAGIVHTVEHPIGTAKAIGHVYADTYGHGWHHFLHSFYEHPLGPVLDAATILTLPFGVGEGLAGSRTANALTRAGLLDKEGGLLNASRRMQSAYATRTLKGARSLAAEGKLRDVNSVVGTAHHFLDQIEVPVGGKLPRRFVSSQVDTLLKRFPAETKYVGEIARFGREIDKILKRGPRSLGLKIGEFQAAYKRLNDDEKVAWHLHATGTAPDEYANLLRSVEESAGPNTTRQEMIARLEDQGVKDAYASVGANPRLEHALDTGRVMSKSLTQFRVHAAERVAAEETSRVQARFDEKLAGAKDEKAAGKLGESRQAALDKVQANLDETKRVLEERPWLHARLTRGATFADTYHSPGLERADERIAKLTAQREKLLQADEGFVGMMKQTKPGVPLASRPYADELRKANEELARLHTARDRLEKSLATRHAGGDVSALREMVNQSKRAPRGIVDSERSGLDALRNEFAQAGREEPVYVPDISGQELSEGKAIQSFSANGGGLAPDQLTRADRFMRQNQGVLYLAGKIALDPQALGDAFYDFGRRQYKQAIHDELIASAVHTDKLPGRNWIWIKERSGQRLPAGELRGEAGEGIEDIVERNAANVTHLAVPKDLVDKLTEEFTRSDKFLRRLWEKPTTVWRAIILHLRVGWLVNNAVGQWFFLMFHYGLGPDMLQAWGSFVRETHPNLFPEFKYLVDRYLRHQNVAPVAKREFKQIEEKYVAPEVYGTLQRSNAIGGDVTERQAKVGRGMEMVGQISRGIAPINAKFTEDIPRELAMRVHVIREARRRGEKIRTETKHFNALADKMLANPHIADRAVKEANRALGDYLTLNGFERNVLRQVAPFYTWFREIARIATNSATDTPGRVDLLTKLGQVGIEWQQQQFGPMPEFLRGLIPFRGGAIQTHGPNPYASLADDINAATALVAGKPGDTGKAIGPVLSPFITGGIQALTGKNLVTGKDVRTPPHAGGGFGPTLLWNQLRELPPGRILEALTGHAEPSKTFGKPDAQRALLDYLGLPFRPKPHH